MLHISELPQYLQDLAIQRQQEAGNTGNIHLIVGAYPHDGGFDWSNTPEGYDYWYNVSRGRFERAEEVKEIDTTADPVPDPTLNAETVADVPKTSAPSKANTTKKATEKKTDTKKAEKTSA